MAETIANKDFCRLSATAPAQAVRRRPSWALGCVVLSMFISFVGCGHASEHSPHRPDAFVNVNEILTATVFDVRYASDENFLGTQVDGYTNPICLLTEPAAAALKRVQQDVQQRGYALKIFDCYRPQRAVDHFVRWVGDVHDRTMKARYYPNEEKSHLIEKGYIADRSGHSRGSTLDLTLVKKDGGAELDMGTPYDYFDALSNTADPRITGETKANRLLLKAVMEKHGFVNYPKEWWHYTLKDEPYPDTYFDFPVQ